jgi:hypothetical protein
MIKLFSFCALSIVPLFNCKTRFQRLESVSGLRGKAAEARRQELTLSTGPTEKYFIWEQRQSQLCTILLEGRRQTLLRRPLLEGDKPNWQGFYLITETGRTEQALTQDGDRLNWEGFSLTMETNPSLRNVVLKQKRVLDNVQKTK